MQTIISPTPVTILSGETQTVNMTRGSRLVIDVDGVEYSILIRSNQEVRVEMSDRELMVKPLAFNCVGLIPV